MNSENHVILTDEQPDLVIKLAWLALLASYIGQFMYRQGHRLVFLTFEGGKAEIRQATRTWLYAMLIRVALWYKTRSNGEIDNSSPPRAIITDMMAFAPSSLPELDKISRVPFFTATGELVSTPGYHAETLTYFDPDPELIVLQIPKHVSPQQLRQAVSTIVDELLSDFPYASQSDKAHMVVAMLQPFIIECIDGVTPLYVFDASAPRSGKTLLGDTLSTVVTGNPTPWMTLRSGEDRIERQLFSVLAEGRSIIAIDNFPQNRSLHSGVFASFLTAQTVSTQKLFRHQTSQVNNKATYILTGNNVRVSNEMAPRCIRIRLNAGVEDPSTRTGFKHENLLSWTRKHRAELIRALLIIIIAWVQAGMPRYRERTLGAFENWCQVMGGILDVAGIPGFLENMGDFREQADEELEEWRDFVSVWQEQFGLRPVLPMDLANLAMAEGLLLGLLREGSERSRQTQMGRLLKSARDRVFNGYRIVMAKDARHRGRWYRLQPIDAEPSAVSLRLVGSDDV